MGTCATKISNAWNYLGWKRLNRKEDLEMIESIKDPKLRDAYRRGITDGVWSRDTIRGDGVWGHDKLELIAMELANERPGLFPRMLASFAVGTLLGIFVIHNLRQVRPYTPIVIREGEDDAQTNQDNEGK